MSSPVRFSPAFQQDLEDLWDHIALTYRNPDAADRIAGGILDAAERLADFPESGKRVFLPGGLDSGYRFLVFESWVVVYRIWRQEVQVARVIPAALDYMRVLFPWLRKGPDGDGEA